MAYKPKVISVTVSAAGTRVRCVTDEESPYRYVPWAYFEAHTGVCYVGDASVASSLYTTKLDASSANPGINWPSPQDPRDADLNRLDLYNTWVDAGTNGDGLFLTVPDVT